MRGRDIERYGYKDNGLYLINTHNGIKDQQPRIDIEDYPAVKAHLDQYWDKIAFRSDRGDTPYNLRSCAYMDDFSKPKIVYMEIMSGNQKAGFPAFTYDEKEHVVMNTGYIMSSESENLLYLLGVLNSKIGKRIIQQYVIQLGDAGYRILAQYTTKFPIVKQPPQERAISTLVTQLLEAPTADREAALNALVYEVYGLCEEEKQYLETL